MKSDDQHPMNDEPDLPEDFEADIWEDDPDAPPTPQERGWDEEIDPDAEDRPAPKETPDPDEYAAAEKAVKTVLLLESVSA